MSGERTKGNDIEGVTHRGEIAIDKDNFQGPIQYDQTGSVDLVVVSARCGAANFNLEGTGCCLGEGFYIGNSWRIAWAINAPIYLERFSDDVQAADNVYGLENFDRIKSCPTIEGQSPFWDRVSFIIIDHQRIITHQSDDGQSINATVAGQRDDMSARSAGDGHIRCTIYLVAQIS